MGQCLRRRKNRMHFIEPLIESLKDENEYDFTEYFEMIKARVSSFYRENQNNQFNISISLEDREFNQMSERKILDYKQKFVYWKDFLVNYLARLSDSGEQWAEEILVFIEEEPFLNEYNWLSMFFWQEFDIRTRPGKLVFAKKKASPLDYIDKWSGSDEDNNLNLRGSRIISHSFDQSSGLKDKLRASRLSERFHASFNSIKSFDEVQNENCNDINYGKYRKLIKAYVNLFNDHVTSKDHPINKIVDKFISTFTKHMKSVNAELHRLKNNSPSINDPNAQDSDRPSYNSKADKNNLNFNPQQSKWDQSALDISYYASVKIKKSEINNVWSKSENLNITFSSYLADQYDKTIKSIQKFILKLQNSVRLMYAKTINYRCFIEEKDEFINMISSLIFKDQEFYNELIKIFEFKYAEEFESFKEQLNELKGIKPQEVGVTPGFCLNEITYEFQELVRKNGGKK